MSYVRIEGTSRVVFKEEGDYLRCRLAYLQYCSDGVMPECSFEQFITQGMYGTLDDVEVESINPSIFSQNGNTSTNTGTLSPTEGNYVIDYNIGTNSPNDTTYVYGNLVVDGTVMINGVNYNTSTSIGETAIFYDHALNGSQVAELSDISSGISQEEEPHSENPKEEPPDDPIDNRFDILDL